MSERVIIARMRPLQVIVVYVACTLGVGAMLIVSPCLAIPVAVIMLTCLAWWYPHPAMLLASLAIGLLGLWVLFALSWVMQSFPGQRGYVFPMAALLLGLVVFVPASAIVLLTTSLRLQKARIGAGDHPECEQCGYDLTGCPSDRCPECGKSRASNGDSAESLRDGGPVG